MLIVLLVLIDFKPKNKTFMSSYHNKEPHKTVYFNPFSSQLQCSSAIIILQTIEFCYWAFNTLDNKNIFRKPHLFQSYKHRDQNFVFQLMETSCNPCTAFSNSTLLSWVHLQQYFQTEVQSNHRNH